MNQDVKAKWLEALRSGEYEQGELDLRNKDDKFCCLGVLCDLAVKEGVIPEPMLEHSVYWYGAASSGLPEKVQEWSGVDTPLGRFGEDCRDPYVDLAALNDRGTPFDEIADIIESEF